MELEKTDSLIFGQGSGSKINSKAETEQTISFEETLS